jgi:hypothetical protein
LDRAEDTTRKLNAFVPAKASSDTSQVHGSGEEDEPGERVTDSVRVHDNPTELIEN